MPAAAASNPTLMLVAPFPPTQGPEADKAYYLTRRLAEHGWQVHVVTTRGSLPVDHPRATVHDVLQNWSWPEESLLASWLEQCRPDAVVELYIDWLYNYHPMMTFFPSLARALAPGAQMVTVFDDYSHVQPWKQPFAMRLGRNRMKRWAGVRESDDRYGTLLRDSHRVVVVSQRVGRRLALHYPGLEAKMHVAPTPSILRLAPADEASRQRRRERLGLAPTDHLLAYFGYLTQEKGVDTLLRALALLCQSRDDVHLILIGGTIQEPEHLRYAEIMHRLPGQLGIERLVHWTGAYAFDSDEASQFLRAADICVLPYDNGVCLHNCSFAGAAAHHLPIVTTRGTELEAAFVDRENVLLAPPENPDALASALALLLDDGQLRERLRTGVAALVREWFAWDTAIERMGLALR